MPDRVSTGYDVGGIQSVGALIGYRKEDEKVVVVSDNLSDFAPNRHANDVLGKSAEHVLGGKVLHSVRNAQSLPNIQRSPELLGPVTLAGAELEASVFEAEDLAVLEFTAGHSHVSGLDLIRDVGRLSDRMKGAEGVDILFSRILGLIRILSGYDRVQVLQCRVEDTCIVIAESRRGPVPETLGMESANPMPTRHRLHPPYLFVHDIHDKAATLRSNRAGSLELPLLSIPKPTPAMVAQLGEQDMQAELLIPLIIDGLLWGVLAFQHRRPRSPSPHFRYVCRTIQPLLEAWLSCWVGVTQRN